MFEEKKMVINSSMTQRVESIKGASLSIYTLRPFSLLSLDAIVWV